MLHAHERLEEIILAALLVFCTTVMLVAQHGGLGKSNLAMRAPLVRTVSGETNKPATEALRRLGTGAPTEDQASADLATASSLVEAPSESPTTSTRPSPGDLGLMQLDFSLEPSGSGQVTARRSDEGSVIVSKPLLAQGTALGRMDITIAEGATLMLEAQQARRVLAGQSGKVTAALERLPDKGLVSFADLRAVGIDLRYSPTEDVIRLNP